MEEEIEMLKKKIDELEKEIAAKDQKTDHIEKLDYAPEPRGLKKQDYEYVEGWKIIDLRIMNEALEIAQKCGHSQVVLVEANRTRMRTGLASHLAYLCITCGSQTVFSSSSFSQEEPSNYVVNKQFSKLGLNTYNSVVKLVTKERTILAVPQDKKIMDSRPTFLFKYEDSGEENTFVETEQVDIEDVKKEPNIKEEPEEDFMEDYLQPSISLTEGGESIYDDMAEHGEDVDPLQDPTASGPQIDVSTITTNTPALAMSTVQPNTEVLGGKVTPWPPHLLIKIQPSLFIRTTCSKVLLPPGLYSYQRDNGLKSIMVVKADSGTFDAIESYYLLMCRQSNQVVSSSGKKVDNKRWDTKVKKTYTSAHRKSPLQLYSQDLQKVLLKERIPREDWDKEIIDRWAKLDKVTKQEYNERALRPLGQSSEPQTHSTTTKDQKKNTNVPLPALKKFALEFAPELKKKKPYLAKVENRGQLNKHLLEMWMQLSQEEQKSYKLLAGMKVEDATTSTSHPQPQSEPSQKKQAAKKLKKTDSDSDSEYIPTSTRNRKRRKV